MIKKYIYRTLGMLVFLSRLSAADSGIAPLEAAPTVDAPAAKHIVDAAAAAQNQIMLKNLINRACKKLKILSRVSCFECGEVFLSEVESLNPDLVIVDDLMIKIDGDEVVKGLPESRFSGKIVAWSTRDAKRAEMVTAGAHYVLAKPADFSNVVALLVDVFGKQTLDSESKAA